MSSVQGLRKHAKSPSSIELAFDVQCRPSANSRAINFETLARFAMTKLQAILRLHRRRKEQPRRRLHGSRRRRGEGHSVPEA